MAEYILYDRDKAAFINRLNKILKQLDPSVALDNTNFIDVPGSGSEDKTIFVTDNDIEEKVLDALIDKRKLSYQVKKVNLKEIVHEIKARNLVHKVLDEFFQPPKKDVPTMIKLIHTAERDGYLSGMEGSAQYVMDAARDIASKFDALNPEEKKTMRDTYYNLFLKKIRKI